MSKVTAPVVSKVTAPVVLTGTDAQIVRPYSCYSSDSFDPPPRNEKILRTYDLILPKFHFILSNFYFGPPWGIFVYSVAISDFLGRCVTAVGRHNPARPLGDDAVELVAYPNEV